MKTVESILVTDFGGYDCLKISDHPLEELKEDEVEVEVHYCGLNFADLYTRQGLMFDLKLPSVLGIECSGIITRTGSSVNELYKVGSKVVCYNYKGGMFRKMITIPIKQCYIIPDSISLKDAACITVNYMTAYFSLMHAGQLRPNQSVLIKSCAGGVGWAATQLAKLIDGVKVYGITSSHKTRVVKQNGVDIVLSYDQLKEQLSVVCPEGLDLLIDNEAGQEYKMKSGLLKPFGRIVFIGSNELIPNEKKISLEMFSELETDISISSLITNNKTVGGVHIGVIAETETELFKDTLNKIFELFLQSKIKPLIDSVWPFGEIVEATKKLQERKNIGKILLEIIQQKN